uniref:DUF6451 domain-containing protein n=1 Tax=Lepisosteus oculatus TaxID=7918 RepID=W5NI65_LEPOC
MPHDGAASDPVEITAGVRQGCILSPLLFLIVIDEILVACFDRKPRRGILWHPIHMDHLDDLHYTNDVLLSRRCGDMQDKLNDLKTKTKSMKINVGHTTIFTVADRPIENDNAFTYLGSQISPDGGTKLDIAARIMKARCSFASLKNIWHSNQIILITEIWIFNSNVKSVLLYGCKMWLVSLEITGKLQAFINRCLLNILCIWCPDNWISNSDIYSRCHQHPIYIENREKSGG